MRACACVSVCVCVRESVCGLRAYVYAYMNVGARIICVYVIEEWVYMNSPVDIDWTRLRMWVNVKSSKSVHTGNNMQITHFARAIAAKHKWSVAFACVSYMA